MLKDIYQAHIITKDFNEGQDNDCVLTPNIYYSVRL